MKKTILALAAISMLGASAVQAAPVNNLAGSETAVGVGTKEIYAEHKVTPKLTAGYQRADRDEYGKQDDVYLQYDLFGSNIKAVGGWRGSLPGDRSNVYGGAAISAPSVMGMQPYVSYVRGADFGETQVGLNVNVIANVDVNINYHNFMPDAGHHETGVGVGATVKF
jgi:opacity protein-like surface antigen